MPQSQSSPARVTVIQDGARLHYAVPLAIQRAGCLERMYTTWYSPPHSLARLTAAVLKSAGLKAAVRMLHRYEPELQSNRVWSRGWITLYDRFFHKSFSSDAQRSIWGAEKLANYVKRKGFGNANTLFGFLGSVHPGLLEFAKEKGLTTIGDQIIASYPVQVAEEILQNERFPGWSTAKSLRGVGDWDAWEKKCWQHTDHITCASDYVRDGLIAGGIAPQRITVLPYPIDSSHYQFLDRSARQGPLKVGFVGAVGLRKGAPYFLEVAKRFPRDQVEFIMVGPLQVTPAAIAQLKEHVQLVGNVPRPEVLHWLNKFDAFFFPSTCEGSAGSVMEAMATGLPIVTSPNAGSIIEHGKTGFLAPYDDIEAHVRAIETLSNDPAKRAEIARAARFAAENRSIDSYSQQWQKLLIPRVTID